MVPFLLLNKTLEFEFGSSSVVGRQDEIPEVQMDFISRGNDFLLMS